MPLLFSSVNSDLSISLNMKFVSLSWIQICNRILCRLIHLQSGYRLSNVECFILIQRKFLLISFIHEEHSVFSAFSNIENLLTAWIYESIHIMISEWKKTLLWKSIRKTHHLFVTRFYTLSVWKDKWLFKGNIHDIGYQL